MLTHSAHPASGALNPLALRSVLLRDMLGTRHGRGPLFSLIMVCILAFRASSFVIAPGKSPLIRQTSSTTAKTRRLMSMSSAQGGAPGGKRCGLVWYKPTDMRLLDHQPLSEAHRENHVVVHALCLDPRLFGEAKGASAQGTLKTGPFRAQFMIESIQDLDQRLRALGSELLVLRGLPEVKIAELAEACGASTVYCHREVCSEELSVQQRLKAALGQVRLKEYWGSYLYHIDDVPFSVPQMPTVFTNFRKAVESKSKVRSTFEVPGTFRPPPALDLPAPLADSLVRTPLTVAGLLGPSAALTAEQEEELHAARSAGAVLEYRGGETAALARLQQYVWDLDLLKTYKETRNGMLGPNYSSKFAPWLAHGNVSPRVIVGEIKRYEKERVANDSTYWLIFELIWRDFFRFSALRFGTDFFKLGGPQQAPSKYPWVREPRLYQAWVDGRTGVPLIDACMRELKATGFLGNRGRQIVGSFLTRDLLLDWRMGAAYFEQMLIDYDAASNWGNWAYVAGVGSDPREDRYFNPVKQAQTYDSDGSYIRYWCPELKDVPTNMLHQPWLLTAEARRQYSVGNYPMPIVRVKAPSGGGGGKGGGGGAKGGGAKGNSNRNGGQYKQARR